MFGRLARSNIKRANLFKSGGVRKFQQPPSIDNNASGLKTFHLTGILLAVHVPLALCGLMPDVIQNCLDDTLSFLFPFHAFVGLNMVISDYVPKAARGKTRGAAFLAMLLAFGGLYKLGFGKGAPGLSKTVKHLWMKKKQPAV